MSRSATNTKANNRVTCTELLERGHFLIDPTDPKFSDDERWNIAFVSTIDNDKAPIWKPLDVVGWLRKQTQSALMGKIIVAGSVEDTDAVLALVPGCNAFTDDTKN